MRSTQSRYNRPFSVAVFTGRRYLAANVIGPKLMGETFRTATGIDFRSLFLVPLGMAVAAAVTARAVVRAKRGRVERAIDAGEVPARTIMLPLSTNPRAKMQGLRRGFVKLFCRPATGVVVGGHAAYRTQLFCYLKSCGREELSTYNLWQGVDAPAPATA